MKLTGIIITGNVWVGSSRESVIDPIATTLTLIHTLDNPNAYGTSANDNFGFSVAVSGNYAIVGAPYEDEDDAGGTSSGKAYIYDVATGTLLFTLENPNSYGTGANDNFGFSVAMSEVYAIVGAPYEDDSSGESGKAYIYDVATGTLLFTLENPNAYGTSANDNFGHTVSISGDYAAVWAPNEEDDDDSNGTGTGKSYIYNVTTGALLFILENPNGPGTFGYSAAMSETHMIIGAMLEDDINGTSSGKASIHDVDGGAARFTLDNPNAYGTSANDNFGFSVAISEVYAIVGAPYEDDAGGTSSGKVYIYQLS